MAFAFKTRLDFDQKVLFRVPAGVPDGVPDGDFENNTSTAPKLGLGLGAELGKNESCLTT